MILIVISYMLFVKGVVVVSDSFQAYVSGGDRSLGYCCRITVADSRCNGDANGVALAKQVDDKNEGC